MSEHPMKDVFNDLLKNLKEMVSSDTIIGDPIDTPDGTRIIPVSKAVFGFASGGTDLENKKKDAGTRFGGGSGAGLTITPVCFLVIKDGEVKLLQVAENVTGVERTISQAPEIISRIRDVFVSDKPDATE